MNYRNAVEFYAKTNSGEIFDNLGPNHAANVLENFFKYSTSEIYMYSGFLDKKVADDKDLIRELINYLKNKNKVFLLIEKYPEVDEVSNFYKILEKEALTNNNIIIKLASEEFKSELKKVFKSGKALHFIVTNNFAFRIETDPEKFKAKCSFNHREYASILLNVIKKYF
ncbi:hypothetical protein N5T79_10175 [Aliarcobacter cryaerophilus]|uniref:hypothetical protein n=1 Tax=Aliarcobacter cryaerophilus TaxID=28198 RepID=UPI0021B4ED0F|nr:hypothetical protein [Aliarcobacter cryaerophilus]MCT7529514.1 hypothetical protein [Aliarcobacter cryaerophilus]